MTIDKEIKKMLTEDCMEVLGYLEVNAIEGKNKVFETVETQKGVDSLENLILQLSRVFGGFAFKNTENVEIFKMRIGHIYKAYPEFKIIAPVYLKEVGLQDINSDLSQEELEIQNEEIKKFFTSLE